jgi:hypothetical protein
MSSGRVGFEQDVSAMLAMARFGIGGVIGADGNPARLSSGAGCDAHALKTAAAGKNEIIWRREIISAV